jgi:Arm DNA-binding domain
MGRSINRLTERTIKSVRVGLFPDGNGLYLQVTQQGSAGTLRHSWLFRYATTDAERVANPELGRERRMGLGAYPGVSLAEARQKAAEARRLREQGIDPINQRDTKRAAQVAAAIKVVTFDQCAEWFLADHARVGSPSMPTTMPGHSPSTFRRYSGRWPSAWSRRRTF